MKTYILALLLLIFPSLSPAQDKIADVVDSASKAIVNIKTEEWSKRGSESRSTDFLRRFFSEDMDEESEAVENIGSGVVLDPSGIVVTNEHLVSKAVKIRIKFTNRQEYDAYVLATDPELDIALLRVESKGKFPCLNGGRKKPLRPGERAIVIGNPYGLSSSVTTGVISALGRNLKINSRIYANLIQTDAAINPGSSGGALLDSEGNLLGIVTAIYEEGKGIGFAIPVDEVQSMVSEFLEYAGKRSLLGVFVEKRRDERGSHIYVNRVIPGSPADQHGVRVADRIFEVNSKKIKDGIKLPSLFKRGNANDGDQLKIVRNGEPLTMTVNGASTYMPSPLHENLCGLRLSDIKGYTKLKYKVREKSGVVVTKVYKGGIGERYGLRAGDVILKVNNADVLDKEEFEALMVEGLRRNYVLYQVKRSDNVFFLPIKLESLL